MKITIFGLSITSSWGNGHATTFRALCQALHRRGHRIVFFEHNVEWYQNNRDLPHPAYCEVKVFESWEEILPAVRAELRDSDVAVVGSYFPDGIAALEEVLASNVRPRLSMKSIRRLRFTICGNMAARNTCLNHISLNSIFTSALPVVQCFSSLKKNWEHRLPFHSTVRLTRTSIVNFPPSPGLPAT